MSLLTNLSAYYKLDESAGASPGDAPAIDELGTSDLTENGTIGSVSGKVNTARELAGGVEYFTRASTPALQLGNQDWTWAGWINFATTSFGFGYCDIIGKGDGGGNEYELYWAPNFLSLFTTTDLVTHSFTPSPGTFYFVVAFHDSVNDIVGISVNAGTPTTASHGSGFTAGSAPFGLGVHSGFVSAFQGGMDEWGLWKDRVLTQDAIDFLFNGGNGRDFSEFADFGGPSGQFFTLARH